MYGMRDGGMLECEDEDVMSEHEGVRRVKTDKCGSSYGEREGQRSHVNSQYIEVCVGRQPQGRHEEGSWGSSHGWENGQPHNDGYWQPRGNDQLQVTLEQPTTTTSKQWCTPLIHRVLRSLPIRNVAMRALGIDTIPRSIHLTALGIYVIPVVVGLEQSAAEALYSGGGR